MKDNTRSLAIAAVVLAAVPTVADAQASPRLCPIDGKWYSLRQPDQWNDAQVVAGNSFFAGRRGQLAVVTDVRVLKWIAGEYGRYAEWIWTGGIKSGTNWYWYTNGKSVSGSLFAPGQPDNYKNREDRLAMWTKRDGLLGDLSKNGPYHYVVQY
jgi:hypothetical protein